MLKSALINSKTKNLALSVILPILLLLALNLLIQADMVNPGVLPPLECLLMVTYQAAVFDVTIFRIHFTGAGHHTLPAGVTDITDLYGSDFTFYFWHGYKSLLLALGLCYRDVLNF